MAKRGRPPKEDKVKPVTRSLSFPPELYEEIKGIAGEEERDVTSQIVKVLRDFVAEYRKAKESGQLAGALGTT